MNEFLLELLENTWLLRASGWTMASMIIASIVIAFTVKNRDFREMLIRWLLLLAGMLAMLLGIVGIFLPIMPTVPFVILAAACWGRGSPRFREWLLNHRYFGQMIRDWEEKRAIPRRAKYMAWGMMTISCTGVLIRLWITQWWWAGILTALTCLAVGIWMSRFPDA